MKGCAFEIVELQEPMSQFAESRVLLLVRFVYVLSPVVLPSSVRGLLGNLSEGSKSQYLITSFPMLLAGF
jgi:hypothetical protein